MTYSIEPFGREGDHRLIGLHSVENLDVFLAEVNKATRLWIEDLDVFVTNDLSKSYDGYRWLNCHDRKSRDSFQPFAFHGKDLETLTSTIVNVFCLPDSHQQRKIAFPRHKHAKGERLMGVILSPAQLQTILSAHTSRRYTWYGYSLSPEQSVFLATKTNAMYFCLCSISDRGQALLDWIESNTGSQPLGVFDDQYNYVWDKVATFLGRCTYPVFDKLLFDQNDYYHRTENRHNLLVRANVNQIVASIDPHLFDQAMCSPLLQALQDGTLVSPELELHFNPRLAHRGPAVNQENDQRLYETTFRALFGAMSSAECQLKGLHMSVALNQLGSTNQVFKEHLIDMLSLNQSIETLTVNSTADSLQFPSMGILDAAAEHPRLRKLRFLPPDFDPPLIIDQSDLFRMWYRANLSRQIRFDFLFDVRFSKLRRVVKKGRVEKWQDYIFYCRFGLLQQVENDRVRSHLLVTALVNHSFSPQRVHFLLSGNQDVFAK